MDRSIWGVIVGSLLWAAFVVGLAWMSKVERENTAVRIWREVCQSNNLAESACEAIRPTLPGFFGPHGWIYLFQALSVPVILLAMYMIYRARNRSPESAGRR